MANRGFFKKGFRGGRGGKTSCPLFMMIRHVVRRLMMIFSDGVFTFKPRRRIFVSSLKKIVKKEKNIHFCFISKVDVEPRTVRYQF